MTRIFSVRDEPITVDEALRAVARPEAGGTAIFVGTVRNENEGESVSLLEYEAYVPMAEKQMAAIAEEIEAESPGVRLAALHRVGRLSIGDAAVVCAASAPHRDEAFRACRALIDRIKEQVPIWKREHSADGQRWLGWEDARGNPRPKTSHPALKT